MFSQQTEVMSEGFPPGNSRVSVTVVTVTCPLSEQGVAVHPEDARYKGFHGKTLVHPFSDRKVPIILDPVLVDMEFGTGAVKVGFLATSQEIAASCLPYL